MSFREYIVEAKVKLSSDLEGLKIPKGWSLAPYNKHNKWTSFFYNDEIGIKSKEKLPFPAYFAAKAVNPDGGDEKYYISGLSHSILNLSNDNTSEDMQALNYEFKTAAAKIEKQYAEYLKTNLAEGSVENIFGKNQPTDHTITSKNKKDLLKVLESIKKDFKKQNSGYGLNRLETIEEEIGFLLNGLTVV